MPVIDMSVPVASLARTADETSVVANSTSPAAYAAVSAELVKVEKARDGWKAQAGLFKDERDQAKRDRDTAVSLLAQAEAALADCKAATPVDCTKAVADARKGAFLEASAVAHEALAKLV
jgi:hypothetical protein